MAGMIEVGQATVTIVPNMQGAQQAISSQLGGICGDAGGIGGANFSSGFTGKLGALKGAMSKILPAAAIAAVGKALFDVGSTFDEMTDSIIIGTGASGDALEGLRQSAMDVATTVPVSFADAGDLIQDFNTRLGLTGDTLTEVATQAAQVGHMTGEAFDVETFSGAMSAWGVSADEMSSKLDSLFAISQSTGVGVNDLASIVETAAPQMSTLGYSIDETAAMAGLLDKAGLDAGSTMSKMSKALTTLAKDGESPAAALQRVTGEISGYIEEGNEAAAINLASQIFGTRGAPQFIAAVKSGALSVDEFSAAMSDSDGIIGETAESTMDFSERATILKNQLFELLEPMGSAVFSGLSTAMEFLTEAFGKFVNGPGQVIASVFRSIVKWGESVIQTFAKAFGDVSGLKSFRGAMTSVGSAIQKVFSFLRPLINAIASIAKTVVPPVAKALGTVLGGAFRTVQSIVNGVRSVIEKFKKVLENVKGAFKSFKETVSSPFRLFKNLKLPKINVSGGKAPWGILGKGERPKFSVEWGAKGGILDGATLIGAGEAGKEALLPLERNTEWMDTLAGKINRNGPNVTYNITVDGAKDPEAYAEELVRALKMRMRTV